MKNLVKFVCSNSQELGRGETSTFEAKYISHPKLKNKNFKNGDYLKKCPDCNASSIHIIILQEFGVIETVKAMEIKMSNLDLTPIKLPSAVERLFFDNLDKYIREFLTKDYLENLKPETYKDAIEEIYNHLLQLHLSEYPVLDYIPKVVCELDGKLEDKRVKVSFSK
jgi:hypothetical protein